MQHGNFVLTDANKHSYRPQWQLHPGSLDDDLNTCTQTGCLDDDLITGTQVAEEMTYLLCLDLKVGSYESTHVDLDLASQVESVFVGVVSTTWLSDLALSASLLHIFGIHCLPIFVKPSQFLLSDVISKRTIFSQPFPPHSDPPANTP